MLTYPYIMTCVRAIKLINRRFSNPRFILSMIPTVYFGDFLKYFFSVPGMGPAMVAGFRQTRSWKKLFFHNHNHAPSQSPPPMDSGHSFSPPYRRPSRTRPRKPGHHLPRRLQEALHLCKFSSYSHPSLSLYYSCSCLDFSLPFLMISPVYSRMRILVHSYTINHKIKQQTRYYKLFSAFILEFKFSLFLKNIYKVLSN